MRSKRIDSRGASKPGSGRCLSGPAPDSPRRATRGACTPCCHRPGPRRPRRCARGRGRGRVRAAAGASHAARDSVDVLASASLPMRSGFSGCHASSNRRMPPGSIVGGMPSRNCTSRKRSGIVLLARPPHVQVHVVERVHGADDLARAEERAPLRAHPDHHPVVVEHRSEALQISDGRGPVGPARRAGRLPSHADVDVGQVADADPFVQGVEAEGGERTRDDAVTDGADQRALRLADVEAGVEALLPGLAARLAERARDLVRPVERRDGPEQWGTRERLGVEGRRPDGRARRRQVDGGPGPGDRRTASRRRASRGGRSRRTLSDGPIATA